MYVGIALRVARKKLILCILERFMYPKALAGGHAGMQDQHRTAVSGDTADQTSRGIAAQ